MGKKRKPCQVGLEDLYHVDFQNLWLCVLSGAQLFVTPGTVAHQPPLWDFPGKNTGVSCHFLLQGIFLTQGFNPRILHLLHCQADSLPLNHQGSPDFQSLGEYVIFPSALFGYIEARGQSF